MIPASVRIYVCTEPQDLRRSFDGLALMAKQIVGEDPQSGAVFVFTNKRSNRLKILWWDRNGYCLLYKRLHGALFRLPPSDGTNRVRIDGAQLAKLLAGVERSSHRRMLRKAA